MSRKLANLDLRKLISFYSSADDVSTQTEVFSRESIGKKLRGKREERNESLGDISKKTRILQKHLATLEAGKQNPHLPSTIERKFLSEYATYLGLDVHEIDKMVRDWGNGTEADPAHRPIRSSRIQWIFSLVIALVALLLFAGAFAMRGGFGVPQTGNTTQIEQPSPTPSSLASGVRTAILTNAPTVTPNAKATTNPTKPTVLAPSTPTALSAPVLITATAMINTQIITPTVVPSDTETPTATNDSFSWSTATQESPIFSDHVSNHLASGEKHYIDLKAFDPEQPLRIEMTLDSALSSLGGDINAYLVGDGDDKWQQVVQGCHPKMCNHDAGNPNVSPGKVVLQIAKPVLHYHLVVVNDSLEPTEYTLTIQNGEFIRD